MTELPYRSIGFEADGATYHLPQYGHVEADDDHRRRDVVARAEHEAPWVVVGDL